MARESDPPRRARAKAKDAAQPRPPGRPRSVTTRRLSLDSEQQARLLLVGGAALIIAIAAAFIAIGWYISEYRPRHRTVLEVNGVTVDFAEMKRRMEYEYFSSPAIQQAPGALPEATYQTLINELTLIEKATESLAVTVTDEEVQQKLSARIGVAPDADQATFTERYRSTLSASGLHDDEYRRMIRAEILEQKVRDRFTAEAPASVPQAKLEVILAQTPQTAREAIDRLKLGEPFDAVAKALSQEPDVQTTGGVKDYAPQGSFDPLYDDFAFTGAIGAISEPIETTGGRQYVVRIADRADRPLLEDQKPVWVSKRYEEWLNETQSSMTIVDKWDEDDQAEALLPIRNEALKRQAEQQERQQQQPQQPPPVQVQPTAPAVAPTAAGDPQQPQAPEQPPGPQP